MRKFYFFLLALLLTGHLFAQKTWIGASGGSWSTAANWSPSGEPAFTDDVVINGFIGTIQFVSPGAGGTVFRCNSLTISGNSTVTFNNNAGNNARSFRIESALTPSSIEAGSSLTITSGGTTASSFELVFFSNHAFTVNGNLTFSGAGSNTRLNAGSSVSTINGWLINQAPNANPTGTTATLFFGAGSTFQIAKNGGSIPTATWNATSTLLITGMVGSGPSNLSSNVFGHFIWNCPGQTAAANPSFPAAGVTFNGNVEIRNTNGNNFRFATAPTVTINGTLTVGNTVPAGSAILDCASGTGNGTFNIRGNTDIKANGTITETGSSTGTALIFNGPAAQNFTNAGTLANTLTYRVNNINNVSLLSNITIPSTSSLDLTSGMLLLGNNNLTIGGNIVNGSSSSFIVTDGTGGVIRNNVSGASLFPVGISAISYSPVTINNASGYNWTVNVVSGVSPAPDPGFNSDKAVLRTWNITPSTNPAVSATTLTFEWNEANAGITGVSYTATEDVSLWRHSGTYWLLTPLSTQAASGSAGGVRTIVVNRPGPALFSPFAISNVTGPLPIRIITFNAVKKSGYNLLHFEADCSTAYGEFEIQRGNDGRNFKTIEQFTATKDRCRLPFDVKDENFPNTRNYYRIKMTDANGAVTYSFAALVVNSGNAIEIVSLQPTVTSSNVMLNISSPAKTKIELAVLSVDGKLMLRKQANLTEGANQIPVNTSALPAGTYYLRGATADGITNTIIFIKQ
jgi:hypothetical protein